MGHVPGDFFHRIEAFGAAWNTISMPATALASLSIAVMIFCLKFAKRIPGAIVIEHSTLPLTRSLPQRWSSDAKRPPIRYQRASMLAAQKKRAPL